MCVCVCVCVCVKGFRVLIYSKNMTRKYVFLRVGICVCAYVCISPYVCVLDYYILR